jgi:tripartite-type tricarboxylate transporter receptor subunit TctC
MKSKGKGAIMKKAACVLMGIHALVLSAIFAPAFAQGHYPDKPVRIMVGFPPGGSQDANARVLAMKLTEALGQQFVVENRGGANGAINAALAAKAKPDGYSLFMGPTSNDAGNVALVPNLAYDPIRDFEPISMVSTVPMLLTVTASLPVKTVKELIALAKAKPGQLNFGSTGIGSLTHLGTELFKSRAGIDMVHIPYKGGGGMQNDLFGGHIAVVMSTITTVLPAVKSGKIRALAVASAKRSETLPDVPTLAEEGVQDSEAGAWTAISAPIGTPKPILTLLNREIVKILKAPDTIELLRRTGSVPCPGTPEEQVRFVKAEIAKWSGVVKAYNIHVE